MYIHIIETGSVVATRSWFPGDEPDAEPRDQRPEDHQRELDYLLHDPVRARRQEILDVADLHVQALACRRNYRLPEALEVPLDHVHAAHLERGDELVFLAEE